MGHAHLCPPKPDAAYETVSVQAGHRKVQLGAIRLFQNFKPIFSLDEQFHKQELRPTKVDLRPAKTPLRVNRSQLGATLGQN